MNSPTAPHVLALESDGHVLLTDGNRLYRYNSNGLLASGLATNWLNSTCSISTIAIQPNGKILLGGSFQFADGLYRAVVRLNQNGLLDPDLVTTNSFANTAVEQILPQPDGRIIVLGSFSEIGGMRRNGIVRLKANGSIDPSFDPGTGVDYLSSDTFRSAVLQSDGKVLLLGHFYSINGTARTGLARLNGDMPMHIHPLGWLPSGVFKVRLDTLPGKTYVLQGSEDLVHWLALRTNSPSGYYVDFQDANAPAATRRFYRALQVQP
jgi:uncharacterized delta-60 repeat protein